MSEPRSWFYLTLWRGTPPEFTSEFNANIAETESAIVDIEKETSAQTEIVAVAAFGVTIFERESIGVEILKDTEVVWYVGG